MFEEFLDLPLHALAVHLPVVLVPLLVVTSLAYALLTRTRRYVGWLAVALAVAAPLSAVVAKLSGDAYSEVLYAEPTPDVEDHQGFGTLAMWSSLGLGAVTLALAAVRRGVEASTGARRWAAWLLTAAVVAVAATAVYFLVRVGHSGAEMTHGHVT